MNAATSRLPVIMVVEDELLIASTLEIALELRGFAVLGPAATVVEALHLLEGSRPDIALIDYRLADTTTEALLQPLQDLGVPVCVLTGYSRQQLPAAYAACRVLEKPFRLNKLIETMEQLKSIT